MSALKKIGGIFAIIGGAFLLLQTSVGIQPLIYYDFDPTIVTPWILSLAIGVMGLIGGILGIVKHNKSGGILTLIGSSLGIICGIIYYISAQQLLPISYLAIYQNSFISILLATFSIPIQNLFYIPFEIILIFVGAILLLISSADNV